MQTDLEFWATHSPITNPGPQSHVLAQLPDDVPGLCRIVQGLLLHVFWAEAYGVHLTEQRRAEVQLRRVSAQLGRVIELDPRPVEQTRPPETRLIGNCRDFSTLLTALLRQQCVPARARCGFGRYFLPNHYEDHWVCEYWHAEQRRWVLVDAQLDALQSAKLGIAFDPLDVPRDQFIVAGQAWRLCRSGQADPATFGIFDMQGLWFVRGNLVRDLASLNKVELLPWDSWGVIEADDGDLGPEDLRVLDEAAELTYGDVPAFERVRALYLGDSRLRVPATIHSYTQQGVRAVDLELAPIPA